MKVILIAAVSNLGKIGDIIEVKNGYAKNFLIPNKKAICFTANNSKIFEAKKHEFEQANQEHLASAKKVQEKIAGKEIIIIENASDDGRLYGSVNSAVVADKVNEITKGKSVSRADIFLQKPIKEIGIYAVKINPHSEVSFEVKVVVSRTESEAEAMLKAEKKGTAKTDKKVAEESAAESDLAPQAVVEEAAPKKTRKKKAQE